MKKILLAISLMTALPLLGSADSVSIYAENDVIFKHDKYYTHATKISYENDGLEYSIAQYMYNPSEKRTPEPLPGDRPYAGLTYFGLGKYIEGDYFEHYFELDAGILGPHSYAAETQAWVHNHIGDAVPAGWKTQVELDAPAVMLLNKESLPLLDSPYFNIIPYTEIAVGDVINSAGIGGDILLGYNVEHSMHNQIAIKTVPKTVRAYVFMGAKERYILNNYLLTGYSDYQYRVEPEDFVADFEIGFCLQYRLVKFYLTENARSKEFVTQDTVYCGFGSAKLVFTF